MTGWAVVCDVWFLEPQTIREGESSEDFANRVKAMIAKKAGLINVPWDGYLKYFRPSERFVEQKRKLYASSLIAKFAELSNVKNEEIKTDETENNLSKRKPKLNENDQ